MPTRGASHSDVAAELAGLSEKLDGFIKLMDERDRQAMFQRSRMEQEVAGLTKQIGELTALKNKGVGVLLALGVLAGLVGAKLAALLSGLSGLAK